MSDVYPESVGNSTEEQAEEGRLTFEQIDELIKGLSETKGVVNLDASLNDVLSPLSRVLGGETEELSALPEFFIIEHYVAIGPAPH
jgi:hypothetical protein